MTNAFFSGVMSQSQLRTPKRSKESLRAPTNANSRTSGATPSPTRSLSFQRERRPLSKKINEEAFPSSYPFPFFPFISFLCSLLDVNQLSFILMDSLFFIKSHNKSSVVSRNNLFSGVVKGDEGGIQSHTANLLNFSSIWFPIKTGLPILLKEFDFETRGNPVSMLGDDLNDEIEVLRVWLDVF